MFGVRVILQPKVRLFDGLIRYRFEKYPWGEIRQKEIPLAHPMPGSKTIRPENCSPEMPSGKRQSTQPKAVVLMRNPGGQALEAYLNCACIRAFCS